MEEEEDGVFLFYELFILPLVGFSTTKVLVVIDKKIL